MLKYHRDAGDRLGDTLSADANLAGVVRQQAINATQERGLAAPRRPHDCDDLALAYVKVDVSEYFERAVAFCQSADPNAWFSFTARGRSSSNSGHRRCLIGHSAACFAGFALILAQ